MDEFDRDVKELLGSKALKYFIEDEYKLITTMMGARNYMTDDQWLALKTNAGIDHSTNPLFGSDFKGVGKFRGIYTLLEDITNKSLEFLQSAVSGADLRKREEELEEEYE
jgi:hypothetical protein